MSWVGWGLRQIWVELAGLTRPMKLQNWLWVGVESSTQARWRLSADCPGGRPGKGMMAAVPPALAPVLYNFLFTHMSLVPPELLTLMRAAVRQCPGECL